MTDRVVERAPEEKSTKTALCSLSTLSTRHHIDSINWQFCGASTEADGGSDGETAAAFRPRSALFMPLLRSADSSTGFGVGKFDASSANAQSAVEWRNRTSHSHQPHSSRFQLVPSPPPLSHLDRFQPWPANNLCTQKLINGSLLPSATQLLPFRGNALAPHCVRSLVVRARALSGAKFDYVIVANVRQTPHRATGRKKSIFIFFSCHTRTGSRLSEN